MHFTFSFSPDWLNSIAIWLLNQILEFRYFAWTLFYASSMIKPMIFARLCLWITLLQAVYRIWFSPFDCKNAKQISNRDVGSTFRSHANWIQIKALIHILICKYSLWRKNKMYYKMEHEKLWFASISLFSFHSFHFFLKCYSRIYTRPCKNRSHRIWSWFWTRKVNR